MNNYSSEKIRNIVLLGHGGCGKTSLVEAMAKQAGLISRIGKVTDGNTISDYDKEEIKRKFSINSTIVPIEWNGCKINVIDTPGYFDFVGQVEEAIRVADAAIIVINGKAGIEVGTEKAWEICEKFNKPRMFFVTAMDTDHASYVKPVAALKDLYGSRIAPFHLPIRENEKLTGYVNIIKNAGRKFTAGGGHVECEIPDSVKADLESARETLMEAVAETSEEFMDRFFEGDEFTPEEIDGAVRGAILDGSMVPVTMGSSFEFQGIENLLNDIIAYLPNPTMRKESGVNIKTGEEFEANFDATKPFSAYIYKTINDPFLGKYSMIKIRSGVLKSNATIYNSRTESEEKLSKLYILRGNKPIEVSELTAGDIGALTKVPNLKTGDTLSTKGTPVRYEPTEVSRPYTYKRYEAVNKGDVDKIAQSLSKMMQEDQTLKVVHDADNRQTLLYGIGDQHLDVVVSKLKDVYKVAVTLAEPKVAFRETIRKKSDVEYKYKKQSGGHGQYGHVKMRYEPLGDTDKAYEFEQVVVGGTVPKNYFPAVEKGIQESVVSGPLAGYPVVGVKAILYDGSYHPVDSSEMAFKTASSQAFKKGFMEASPVLLEPIASLKVVVPDSFTGDVMGDLNKRRGRVLGMNPCGKGKTCVEADIPMLELFGYNTDLRSMTGGRGDYSYEFARYEQAPADIQEKQIAARAAEKED